MGYATDMTRKPNVADVAAALSGRGRHGRSPLYWWIWDNYADLNRERQGRADWISVTEELTKLGLTNRDGSSLRRENVRKTWERVVRDQTIAADKPGILPRPSHTSSATGHRPPAALPTPAPDDDDDPPPRGPLKRAKIR